MGLAVTLDLRHLHERLVADARLGIGPVHGLSVEGLRREHDAIAQVAVVRDGQHLATRLLRVCVHVLPEVRRILAVEGGIGNDLVHAVHTVAENDGAMKILAAGRGRPFEAVQRGENARLVPLLGGRGGVRPGRGRELVASKTGLPVRMETTASMAALMPSAGLVLYIVVPALAVRVGEEFGAAGANLIGDTHVLGMVGDGEPVQRPVQFEALAVVHDDFPAAWRP